MAARRPFVHGPYWRLKLLAAVSLLVLVGWLVLGRLEHALLTWRIQTALASYGTEETRVDGEAVILRREQVIRAPAAGRVTLLVGEGRRVRANDVILEIDGSGDVGPLPADLERINRELNRVAAAASAERGTLRRRREEAARRLADAERVLRDALAIADEDAAREAQSRRDAFAMEIAQIDERLERLEGEEEAARRALLEERQAVIRLRPSDVILVRAPAPGYVSFAFDGLEEAIRPGLGLDQMPENLRPIPARVDDGLRVSGGDPLFRLIDGGVVEVAVTAPAGIPLTRGERVELLFTGLSARALAGSLLEAAPEAGRTLLLIRLDSFDPDLIEGRIGKATLSFRKAQGIVVPARSVIEVGGRRGLYVMVGDRPVFREVRVLGGNERRLVVDGVSGVPVGAPVVTNPELIARRGR